MNPGQSSKFDFSDPYVRLEYVPEMGCSVGGCISGLKKLWKSYKIAGRNHGKHIPSEKSRAHWDLS